MSNDQKRNERILSAKRRDKLKSIGMIGGISLVLLILIGFTAWKDIQPPVGEGFPIMAANHIADNEPPGEYNSDPPTSGPHYAEGLPGGFYQDSDLQQLPPYPVGHLVHNLEHGYIIFWYNCDVISESACAELKTQIKEFQKNSNNKKLVAFPWKSIKNPLVLTSWGYSLRLNDFEESLISKFINRNRSLAPEPNAP